MTVDSRSRTISILTPVFNPPVWAFELCAQSVLPQLGDRCEWVLVDDGSTDGSHKAELENLGGREHVTVVFAGVNQGISGATNTALSHAAGEFVAFLDQDDELSASAIDKVLQCIDTDDQVDVVYSDEDKIDENGKCFGAFRKPGWSPERLRHQNYLSHLTVIRRTLVNDVGGLRDEFDGSQDFDLVLRCTERAKKIAHIPEVLYHWRTIESSTASDPAAKPQAHAAAVRAVQDHLDRTGISGTASLMSNMYVDIQRRRTTTPKVSIVIPSRGSEARIAGAPTCLVENCVASLIETSTYPDIEVVIVLDTDSPAGLGERLIEIDPTRVQIVAFDDDFNFAAKINRGVMVSRGEVIVPLNDDIQVASPDWIEQLVVLLEEPDVGMSAPLLLLEDGRIQSAGHFFEDGAHHVGAGLATSDPGPFGLLSFESERSGATFAAIAIRRDVFETVGGMFEGFPRAFNDVDFGNKLRLLGYRIVFTPKAVLHHFESLTRDPAVEEFEVQRLYQRWGSVVSRPDEYLPQFWRQHHGLSR